MVERLKRRQGFRRQPAAAWIASHRSVEEAKDVYRGMAEEISAAGLNLNLAPVVDLDLDPLNPVIGKLRRSFGDTSAVVANYADAFVQAHRNAGVLTALKHWPGHGSGRTDPHFTTTNVGRTWREEEIEPFRLLIRAGLADMVMVGHLASPRWSDEPGRPASLSSGAIRRALRTELGYDGVVITDDLQMRAATQGRDLADTIVQALAAGSDLVLLGNVLDRREQVATFAGDAIERGIRERRLDPDALRRSFERVLRLKQTECRSGLWIGRPGCGWKTARP